tara:strand:+ start:38 stop:487 length:450 start_codon:yes stop_codon:yes gene_type:complete
MYLNKFKKIIITICLLTLFMQNSLKAKNDYYEDAKKFFLEKNYEKSKFLFQRNIVFNPKDYNSYLYLAKIFKNENNNIEFEINLNTTLLLNPENEEAMYMLIEQKIDQSNFLEVAELKEKFSKICKELCDKKKLIDQKLKNFDTNNEVE